MAIPFSFAKILRKREIKTVLPEKSLKQLLFLEKEMLYQYFYYSPRFQPWVTY
jgi:hypothetical protein